MGLGLNKDGTEVSKLGPGFYSGLPYLIRMGLDLHNNGSGTFRGWDWDLIRMGLRSGNERKCSD